MTAKRFHPDAVGNDYRQDGHLYPNPWSASCPSRELIGAIASKWVLLIIPLLREGPMRNGDLLRAVEGVSQKMLTQTLRNLQRYLLVQRKEIKSSPPNVEYLLTELGVSLADRLTVLDAWVIDNFAELSAGATLST